MKLIWFSKSLKITSRIRSLQTMSVRQGSAIITSTKDEINGYKAALDQDLPIGPGRVESGNRSVIQRRLKLPGAWC